MKRSLHVVADLVVGAFYGCILGLFVYLVLFFLLAALMKSSQGQSIGFEIGLFCIPLMMFLKVREGQRRLSQMESDENHRA